MIKLNYRERTVLLWGRPSDPLKGRTSTTMIPHPNLAMLQTTTWEHSKGLSTGERIPVDTSSLPSSSLLLTTMAIIPVVSCRVVSNRSVSVHCGQSWHKEPFY